MEAPLMLRVRFAGTNKFLGLSNLSYAVVSDDDWALWTRGTPDQVWGVPEKRAKVWTDLTTLRRLLSLAARKPWKDATFSQYEAVYPDGTFKPLDEAVRDV